MGSRTARAAVAGTFAGIRLATKSYEPSLMRRSAIDQGLAAGGSFLAGFAAASVASATLDVLPGFVTTPLLRVAGFAAAGARAVDTVGEDGIIDTIDPEQAAWLEFGAEIVSSVALARIVTGDGSRIGRIGALGAFGAATAVDAGRALGDRDDHPDAKYLATSAAVALGSNLALVSLLGVVRLGGWLPARLLRSRPLAGTMVTLVGSAATAAALREAAGVGLKDTLGKISAGNRATEIAYADAPTSNHVTGGPASTITYGTLGVQGRRLVSEVVTSETIIAVMGSQPSADPVRAYVGIDSAESDEALVAAAITELERLGGFERSTIIAAAPAGTGYVNYIAVEAAELMSLGDCATVAIQYGSLPSMLSLNRVGRAASLYAALLLALRDEIDRRDSTIELVAYGESLGAMAGQNGVDAASGGGDLIVDRGLWVGTPVGSVLFDRLTSAGVPVFDSPDDLADHLANHPAPQYVFLNHHNDPVTKFTPTDLYKMPDWLRPADRGRGTNPHQRWLPGVAFFQGLIDTKNAATVIPGEFYSTGHDYRADLASFIEAAYGFDVSDDQMERIEQRLRASEIARSDGISLGKIQTA